MIRRNKPVPVEFFYDPKDEPIVLPKSLFDLIFLHSETPTDSYALYGFYYANAKWNENSEVLANVNQTAIAMRWGTNKVIKIKNDLKRLGLIEDTQRRDGKGKMISHGVKVHLPFTTVTDSPVLVKSLQWLPKKKETQDIYSIYLDSPKKKGTEITIPKKPIIIPIRNQIPPKLEWIQSYAKERKSSVNPQTFYDWNTAKGWKIGKERMKDWQAAFRTWEQRDGKKQEEKEVCPMGLTFCKSFSRERIGCQDCEDKYYYTWNKCKQANKKSHDRT